MSKIAVILKDGAVSDVAEFPYSLYQDTSKGWKLVDEDSAFSIDKKADWTIRESDNKLVHVSTNKTPEEEYQDTITLLTTQNLQLQKDNSDLKSGLTASTMQNLSLSKDSADLKSAVSTLTQQLLLIQSKSTDTNETTK